MVSTRSKGGANILTLDQDTPVQVRYHAEGAANVVFVITSSRITSIKDDDYGTVGTNTDDGIPRIDVRLKGKLLRLRKDVPSVTPVVESHRHYEEHIEPLFPAESLVEQLLCRITPGFVRKCNAALRIEEEPLMKRPKKRHGTNLSETEPYGLLITDMTCDDKHASTEFKPKWLAQSPSAPKDSKRCRTCALRALRDVKTNANSTIFGRDAGDFCPLKLVSGDEDVIRPSLEPILIKSIGAPLDMFGFIDQTLPYFQNLHLFRLLRDLQIEKDPKGILKIDPSDVDFMTAMALRDCTFFLKIPNQYEKAGARIEARLGDLDLKTPDGGKAEYWRETEQQLINEGWYTATEKTPAPKGRASITLATCNADNVLRALRHNGAQASPFCSTYTLPPPNQPLPTYVSQYPASRVSSGCSCLITPGPTASTTCTTSSSSTSKTSTSCPAATTVTPGSYQCCGELIRNGGFQTIIGRAGPIPWEFAQEVRSESGAYSRADWIGNTSFAYWGYLVVNNSRDSTGGYGTTYIRQPIPALCKNVYYTLSFDADTKVYDGHPGKECSLEISLNDQQLVYNGPNGPILPFGYQRRSYTFVYSRNSGAQALTIRFTCTAPSGSFLVDNISLIGQGENF
ncbi:MAG: hypothetical protein Q9213_007229 [Squamulea squamosa]